MKTTKTVEIRSVDELNRIKANMSAELVLMRNLHLKKENELRGDKDKNLGSVDCW